MSDRTALENEMSLLRAFTPDNEDTKFQRIYRNMKTEARAANGA